MKNTILKNSKWLKVSQLKVGQRIAVPKKGVLEDHARGGLSARGQTGDNDLMWDEIVAVNRVGRERVCDVEVEGTRNFVGNNIFAHNTYIGNVGIGNASPVAKLHINDSEEASFVVTSGGKVGIGTTTPSYKLSVAGDVAATAFVNISTRTSKIDIQYLSGEEEKNILDKIKSANVARYRYGIEDPGNPQRLGLIAEEAPVEVLSIDGQGVDIYKLSSFILAGVKAQQLQIDQIKSQISNLKSQIGISSSSPSNPISTPSALSTIISVAKSALASLASTMGDWANAVLAESTQLKVTSENSEDINYEVSAVTSSRDEVIASGSATLVMASDAVTGNTFARARIKFDSSFTSLISETEPIKVIVTPTTRLNGGLYVHAKSRFGFEAREINAYDEGGMFDWMVIARKKGGETGVTGEMAPAAQETPFTPSEPITPIEPIVTPSELIVEEPVSPIIEEPVAPAETATTIPTSSSDTTTNEVGTPTSDVGAEPAPEPTPPAEEQVTPPAEEAPPPAEEPAP